MALLPKLEREQEGSPYEEELLVEQHSQFQFEKEALMTLSLTAFSKGLAVVSTEVNDWQEEECEKALKYHKVQEQVISFLHSS